MTYFEIFIYSFLWWQILSSCIISAGYHRYFTHKSFNAPVWYEYLVLLLGPLSGAGPILGWAGVHRMHHAYSDTERDPHSPKYKGFWTVLTSSFRVSTIQRKFIKDLLRNKRVMFFYRHHLKIRIVTIVLGAFIFPLEWFFILFITPFVYGNIGYGLINALCHKDGVVRNSVIANLFTGGEGWHVNHHEKSNDWKIGKKWYQWDPGSWFISIIKIGDEDGQVEKQKRIT
jgi:fatty-acid desaturase